MLTACLKPPSWQQSAGNEPVPWLGLGICVGPTTLLSVGYWDRTVLPCLSMGGPEDRCTRSISSTGRCLVTAFATAFLSSRDFIFSLPLPGGTEHSSGDLGLDLLKFSLLQSSLYMAANAVFPDHTVHVSTHQRSASPLASHLSI